MTGPESSDTPDFDDFDDADEAPAAAPAARKDDALTVRILSLAAENEDGISPQNIAKSFFADHRKAKDPDDAWRRYLNPVKQQMVHLARQGRVQIVRKKNDVVDPDDFRGLVRVRLPRD